MRTSLLWRLPLLVMLAALSACTSIDFEYPRSESQAFTDTDGTGLARALAPLVANRAPGESGFHVLNDGIDALAARLLLIERAERAIDAQYYLISNDPVGRVFVDALLQAADRGVRVRLLLDDIQTSGYDAAMVGMDAHPNVEMRVFNPFGRAGGRGWSAITDFRRINRRMHNKSLTVDNQVTIVGGRNIADEYFGANKDVRFADLDVAAVGPMVQDVSAMFDTFWNHDTALPVPAFAKMPDDPSTALTGLRDALQETRGELDDTPYAEALARESLALLEGKRGTFEWATYELVYDSPDKGLRAKAKDAASITTPLRASLSAAEEGVIVISPYFVPRKTGVEGFSALAAKGVDVTVVTNSLAANNQSTVHGGYAPSRKPLLRAGVKLYEVRADAQVAGAEVVATEETRSTLHTKAFVVDRREVFIGSFNFDPRSANINTELGVIIRSTPIATAFAAGLREQLRDQTFELFLNEQGALRWRGVEGGREVVLKREPQTSWSKRFSAGVMRLLPIRGQL
ncbi:MAG: phospholipase D family protein [Pseudomonadota bacterium]